MSGQELPAVSMEGISDVRNLKASLRCLHGFPIRMQQFLHNGNILDSSIKIDAPIDSQLVLLALATDLQQLEAAKELRYSYKERDVKVVRPLLEGRANADARDDTGRTAFLLAAKNGHVETARLLLEAGWQVVPHSRGTGGEAVFGQQRGDA